MDKLIHYTLELLENTCSVLKGFLDYLNGEYLKTNTVLKGNVGDNE